MKSARRLHHVGPVSAFSSFFPSEYRPSFPGIRNFLGRRLLVLRRALPAWSRQLKLSRCRARREFVSTLPPPPVLRDRLQLPDLVFSTTHRLLSVEVPLRKGPLFSLRSFSCRLCVASTSELAYDACAIGYISFVAPSLSLVSRNSPGVGF